MKRVGLSTLCLLVVASGLTACSNDSDGGGPPAGVKAPTGSLVINTGNGLRLRPAPTGAVSVTGRVHGRWSGDAHARVLDLDCPATGACDRTPTVTVPAGLTVIAVARDAGVDVVGLTGDLTLTTVNGDVALTRTGRAEGTLKVATRNGSIQATDIRASAASAQTVNGDVVLDWSSAPTTLSAASTNGSVRLTVPPDAPAYAVTATTQNGRPSITLPTVPSGVRTLSLRTVNGDVTAARS